MKNLKLFLLPLFNLTIIFGGTILQSPSQFLGYELGDKFTFHHDAVDYFEHVSTVSKPLIKTLLPEIVARTYMLKRTLWSNTLGILMNLFILISDFDP